MHKRSSLFELFDKGKEKKFCDLDNRLSTNAPIPMMPVTETAITQYISRFVHKIPWLACEDFSCWSGEPTFFTYRLLPGWVNQ